MENYFIGEEQREEGRRILLLIQISVLLILFIFMLAVSGGLQWTVGVIILIYLGFIFTRKLLSQTDKLENWETENKLDDVIELQMPRLSKYVKNAFKGRRLSQDLLERRMTKDFLEKVMEEKNLDKKQVNYLINNPDKLEDLIDDDELTDFILQVRTGRGKTDEGEIIKSKNGILKSNLQVEGNYEEKIKRILKKMEEWS